MLLMQRTVCESLMPPDVGLEGPDVPPELDGLECLHVVGLDADAEDLCESLDVVNAGVPPDA